MNRVRNHKETRRPLNNRGLSSSSSLFDYKTLDEVTNQTANHHQNNSKDNRTIKMVHCDIPEGSASGNKQPPHHGTEILHNHQQHKEHHHETKDRVLQQQAFSSISSMHAKSQFSTTAAPGSYQNTYEVEPTHPFDTKAVRTLVRAELDHLQRLTSKKEVLIPTNADCLKTADSIKSKLKAQGYRRYRFIVNMTLANNCDQTFKVSSRFFWDAERDKYICQTVKNKHFYLVCVVYAVYFE